MYAILYFFFFSSRRRHTRSLRDWSSDVCSSDLTLFRSPGVAATYKRILEESGDGARDQQIVRARDAWYRGFVAEAVDGRSEERRVGKECRCRWSPDE